MTDERTLAFLRELARADEEAAAVLVELDELLADVETVREEAARLAERTARLPDERVAAEAARRELEAEVARRADAERAGAEALAAAEARRDDARLAAARREHVRARDLLHSASRRLARTSAEEERLAAEEEEVAAAGRALAERARELAARIAARPGLAEASPEPAASLHALGAWATEARAALLVARSQLAAQREAVIRQANELGALVLGEPLTAQSAALVARRVAEHG